MSTQKELDIVLKAKNDTKQAFNEVNKSLDTVSKTTEKATSTTSGLWKQFALGQAVFTVASKALSAFGGFMKDSVTASIDAEAQMAIVKQNVQNAGFAYEEVGGKIEEYSKKLIQLGFDDEETATAQSKFLQITKDIGQAQQLTSLATDLARNKHIDLATATKLLTNTMQGNNKVLKEYGIVLGDDATAGQALDAVQKAVGGSAQAFADTTAGKLEILKTQWANIKETVGEKLSPVLSKLIEKISSSMPAITNVMAGFGGAVAGVANVVIDLANAWSIWTGTAVQQLDKTLEGSLNVVADRFNADQAKIGHGLKITADEINNLDQATKKDLLAKYGKGATETAQKISTLNSSFKNLNVTTSASVASAGKMSDAFKKLAEQSKDSIQSVKDDIQKVVDSIAKLNDEKISLNLEYQKSVEGINKDIGTTYVEQQKKIVDLTQELANERVTIAENSAKRIQDIEKENNDILDKQNELKKLQTNLTNASTEAEKTSISESITSKQKDLDLALKQQKIDEQTRNEAVKLDTKELADKETTLKKEQQALEDNKDIAIQYAKEIANAQRFAGLTEFEQKIEEYNNKKALLLQEFNDKVNMINQEIALEEAKKVQLQKIQNDLWASFQMFMQNQKNATESSINAQIEKYKELQAAATAVANKANVVSGTVASSSGTTSSPVYTSSSGATTTTGLNGQAPSSAERAYAQKNGVSFDTAHVILSATGKALGGNVNENQTYKVGENGPEYFTPNSNGYITPNNKVGSTINITITGNQLLDNQAGKKIAETIFKQLKLKANFI